MADKSTNLNEGLPEHRGLDAAGRAAALARLEPRAGVKVGNLADVQRYGAEATDETVQLNPNQDEEDLITPAENDARQGLITVETDRTGMTKDVEKAQEKETKNLQPASRRETENKGKERPVEDPSVESPKASKK